MKVLGIYGASGLGREVLELAKTINNTEKKWDEFVFIDDGDVPKVVSDCNVYTYEEAKGKYSSNLQIAMGIGEPTTRERLFSKIKADKIETPNLIHPNVHIPKSVSIGSGVIIQTGCYVSVNVTIQDYVYLQPMCAIGHDSVLKKGCIISTMDSIAGAVTVGQCTYIGMSSAVKELVDIGDYSIIGMGSMVFKDIPDEMIAMGNPARPMKKNEEHRVFGH
jgi:sugar O-acyltransferase (sialic acid O-acetyltransferase NeuD family)